MRQRELTHRRPLCFADRLDFTIDTEIIADLRAARTAERRNAKGRRSLGNPIKTRTSFNFRYLLSNTQIGTPSKHCNQKLLSSDFRAPGGGVAEELDTSVCTGFLANLWQSFTVPNSANEPEAGDRPVFIRPKAR
ncbi:hypothetical protein V1282_001378 [Nitrobacteraceae bacterium AZCC 2146]